MKKISHLIVLFLYMLPCLLGLLFSYKENPTVSIALAMTLLFDVFFFLFIGFNNEKTHYAYIFYNPLIVLITVFFLDDVHSLGLIGIIFVVRVLVAFFGDELIKKKENAYKSKMVPQGLPKDVIDALAESSLSGSNYIVNMSTEGTVFPEEAVFNIMEILGAEQAIVDDSYDKYSCVRSLNDELREVRRSVVDYNRQLKAEEQAVNREVNKQILDTYKSQKR